MHHNAGKWAYSFDASGQSNFAILLSVRHMLAIAVAEWKHTTCIPHHRSQPALAQNLVECLFRDFISHIETQFTAYIDLYPNGSFALGMKWNNCTCILQDLKHIPIKEILLRHPGRPTSQIIRKCFLCTGLNNANISINFVDLLPWHSHI